MEKNTKYNPFFYLTAYLVLLIPAPGRFVYGFTLMSEMLLLSVVASLALVLVDKLKIEPLKSTIFILILVSFACLYRQIVAIINPEIALTLGFVLFLPPVSLFILNILFSQTDEKFLDQFTNNILKTLFFTVGGMVVFLIRDIFGYGTFTFFGKNHHIYEKILFNSESTGIFSILASIPGVLILLGLFYLAYIQIDKIIKILKNKG